MLISFSLNDDSENAFPWIVEGTNCAVKGYIYKDGKILKNIEFFNYVKNNIRHDNYLEFINDLDGFFSLIIDLGDNLIAVTDLVNTTPIFYKECNEGVVIGDNYIGFISEDTCINEDVIDQYLLSGYCYNEQTLLKDVFQVNSASILKINKKNKKIENLIYYSYLPDFNNQLYKSDENKLIDELHNVHIKVFKKLISGLDGRRVILPLSGGYDSRLILEMLINLGYKNILCVTWGRSTDWQVKIAKKVALDFDVEWKLINPTHEEWYQWYINNFEMEMKYSGAISSIPYLQENLLISKLEKDNILLNDDIFLSGNSGDFIEGEHIPQTKSNALETIDILNIIKDKHQRLNVIINNELIDKSIKRDIKLFKQENDIDMVYFFEYWEWKERQSKFVTNCIKPFESQGYEWRMPFWNKDIMNFWRSINVDSKIHRSLFYKYSNKYMNQLTVQANPSLSVFKRYSERLLDPRFGCYPKVNLKNLFLKNVNKVFTNVDFDNIEMQRTIYYKFNSLVAMDVINRMSLLKSQFD